MENARWYAISRILFDYLKSPSLRHLRDPHSIQKLAGEIMQAVDRAGSIWTKWEGLREDVARAAASCWIPLPDLTAFLNQLPGPKLSPTDVRQRLRAIWEEQPYNFPDEDLKQGCLVLYEAEKAQGTELMAIIGALQEFVEAEGERRRLTREAAYRRLQEEERIRLQERFLSGADCGWTAIDHSAELYCRRNGRAFRIQRDKDKRWRLFRISDRDDEGDLVGTYSGRREAGAVLEKMAYAPEPRQ